MKMQADTQSPIKTTDSSSNKSSNYLGGEPASPETPCVSGEVSSCHDVDSPHLVIRGANDQETPKTTTKPKNTVRIDWLRVTGPRERLHQICKIMSAFFGEGMDGNRGGFFQSHSIKYGSAVVYYNLTVNPERKQHTIVEIPGQMLAELVDEQVQQLTYQLLGEGCRSTRCDVAIDLYDHPELVDLAASEYRNHKLVGAKRILHIVQETSGKTTGKTLNVGVRGKDGSGRYLRIYDKGLETKTEIEGEWIRWEVEFTDDCATEFVNQYASANSTVMVMKEHAYGAVDFLESPHKQRQRRTRCAWFQSLLDGLEPITLKKKRCDSSMLSKVRWFQTCVRPALHCIAEITSKSLDEVITGICGSTVPRVRERQLHDPFIREICSVLGTPAYQIVSRFQENIRVMGTAMVPSYSHSLLACERERSESWQFAPRRDTV